MNTLSISVAFFVFLIGGLEASAQNNLVKSIIQSTQQRFAPDQRTSVFSISYSETGTGIILKGEIDNQAAKVALVDTLRKNLNKQVYDSIRVLPDPSLGSKIYGIIIRDAGDIRRNPDSREELLTQALMGTVVKLLKTSKGYLYVRMPDHYLGWLDANSMYITDQDGVDLWHASDKVIVTELKYVIREKPHPISKVLCEIVAGCILKKNYEKDGWTLVELADGRKGFIPDTVIQDINKWEKSRTLTGESLENTAKAFMGVPYLWGGITAKGMDCSGFMKMVFMLNGIELDRDANQQVKQGTNIEPGKDFKNLQKGDLLFFGKKSTKDQSERITHVGLYLGNSIFIHSSKRVRLNSLDPASLYFEESLLRTFVQARRIIQK